MHITMQRSIPPAPHWQGASGRMWAVVQKGEGEYQCLQLEVDGGIAMCRQCRAERLKGWDNLAGRDTWKVACLMMVCALGAAHCS
jgi:hypothetical protein